MQSRRKTVEKMTGHYKTAGRVRLAADFPAPGKIGSFDHEAQEGHSKRAIPEGHSFDPRALKPLAKMLWSMSVALGHALTAHRQFTKVKSATVSPDGLVGGRGYVMSVKDIRKALYDACESLSAISDTVHDEITAPHWKPKLGQLEKGDLEDIENLVGDAERILDNPEEEAEEELEKAEDGKGLTEGSSWHHPAVRKREKDKEPRSGIPEGGDSEAQPRAKTRSETVSQQQKQASTYGYDRRANSSLPVDGMPGGPRVDHLDRAEPRGPFGSYNQDEPVAPKDEWARTEGVGDEYNYPSDWDNDLKAKQASLGSSGLPDANIEDTPTQGFDFGIGQGNGNDAHGQAAGGYGEANPSSGAYGVWGPHAEMPSDPGAPTKDNEVLDTTPMVEQAVGGKKFPTASVEEHIRLAKEANPMFALGWSAEEVAQAKLPNDDEPDVARSDYYDGPKGSNLVDSVRGSTHLPGEQLPAKDTPLTPRPSHLGEHMFAQSGLPGEDPAAQDTAVDIAPGTNYRYERGNQPYVKWDYTTHEMRPDPTYQRQVEGPYVKPETVRPSDG